VISHYLYNNTKQKKEREMKKTGQFENMMSFMVFHGNIL